MEKIIAVHVSRLLSKLSSEKPYYTQNDLSVYGFPPFLIKRITFHLLKELNKEFTLPGEKWVNTDSEDLQTVWAELQRSIRREIQLPASLTEKIIGKSVRECVGMTIQPRIVIPELLFDGKDELDINILTERSSAITVNRFLVWSMIRYMEKKDKQSMHITDSKRIIEAIDDKIVENYHPLNWLSLVKPLFELSGSTVHSDLFRLFFEHKGKNPIAKEFDLVNSEIKESKFIEVLSSPDSIYVEGYKDDQQALFQDEANKDEINDGNLDEDVAGDQDEVVPEQIPFHPSLTKDPEEEELKEELQKEGSQEEEGLEEIDPEEKGRKKEMQEELILIEEETEEVEDSISEEFLEDEGEAQEKLIAPWDDDEDEEGHTEILEAENESAKEEEQLSDAALLEIEDEKVSESDDEVEDEEESESSLLNRFMFDDSDSDDSTLIDKSETEEKVKTIYDELNLVRNDTEPKTMDLFGSMGSLDPIDSPADTEADKMKTDLKSEEPEVIQKFSDMYEFGEKEDSDETEIPMWKSFLDRDEEVKSAFQFDDGSKSEVDDIDSDEELDEDGYIEEPIYDFTKKEPDIDEKIGGLNDWMQDVREKFIEELFGGSEEAYEQALSDIVEFDDWKNASRYIEKEIFTRNRIDVYGEIAVDFTDRLHSYFIENKS